MSKHAVIPGKRALRKVAKEAIEVIEPASGAHRFFSFRYSFTEISVHGEKARLKSSKTRFEDGKLTSEAFEGELDRSAYDQMVSQVQRYVWGQTEPFLKALALLLRFSAKPRPDRD